MKVDPGRMETIENLWNSEKQISPSLNYSKFLISESPSSKKQNSTWNKPECEEACTSEQINCSFFCFFPGLKQGIMDEANCKLQIIKNNSRFMIHTICSVYSSDRFHFIWQTNVRISLHFLCTNQLSQLNRTWGLKTPHVFQGIWDSK